MFYFMELPTMPIYEYECKSCHHHLDLMQKMSDPPATQCPQCSQDTLVKLVSAAGFQLKGTGWYVTDFKDKKNTDSTTNKKETTTSNTPKELSTSSSGATES